ncbi:hypothetical protein [Nocardioides convexus]|uniref:hypothetical protein n=1 Tax=Nocardioides convexus TaxID=2712224 RepID=UPI0024184256|nr:hypothetical protein [Nocardioides convexus]
MSASLGLTGPLQTAIAEAEEPDRQRALHPDRGGPARGLRLPRRPDPDGAADRLRLRPGATALHQPHPPVLAAGARQPGRGLPPRLPARGRLVRDPGPPRHVGRPVLPGDGRDLLRRLGRDLADGLRRARVWTSSQMGAFSFAYTAEPGAKTLIVREVFNDWDTEERGTLSIERADTVGRPRRPLTEDLLRKKYEVAARSLTGSIQTWFAFPHFFQYKEPVNTLTVPSSTPGGLSSQYSSIGHYETRRGRGDDRDRPPLRRLHLPGHPDRLRLVRLHRLRDPPDLAHEGPGRGLRGRSAAVRDLRASAGAAWHTGRELAGDHRPPHRADHAALAAGFSRALGPADGPGVEVVPVAEVASRVPGLAGLSEAEYAERIAARQRAVARRMIS